MLKISAVFGRNQSTLFIIIGSLLSFHLEATEVEGGPIAPVAQKTAVRRAKPAGRPAAKAAAQTPAAKANSCQGALALVEEGISRAETNIEFTGGIRNSPVLTGYPLHWTTKALSEFIWVAHPSPDTDYMVIKKGESGFGFGEPEVHKFNLMASPGVTLRSLDFSGVEDVLLATFVAGTGEEKAVVFKAVVIDDEETGKLRTLPVQGFASQVFKDTGENFVVSARPDSYEFWITDGSSQIRVIQIVPKDNRVAGIAAGMTVSLPESFVSVEKLQYFSDGHSGYIRYRNKDGKQMIAPFLFMPGQEEVPASDDGKGVKTEAIPARPPMFKVFEEASVELPSGITRTTIHPESTNIYASTEDEIIVYYWSPKTMKVKEISRLSMKGKFGDWKNFGIEFYREPMVREITLPGETEPNHIPAGAYKGAVLIGRPDKSATRVIWVTTGDEKTRSLVEIFSLVLGREKFREVGKSPGTTLFSSVPEVAGVYLMLDRDGEVIYVGKANSLRQRLLQYNNATPRDSSPKVLSMLREVVDIVYEVAENETAALLLENKRIREFRPPYNRLNKNPERYPLIQMKSGENFLYLRIAGQKQSDEFENFGVFRSRARLREMFSALLRQIEGHTVGKNKAREFGFPQTLRWYGFELPSRKATLSFEKKMRDFFGGRSMKIFKKSTDAESFSHFQLVQDLEVLENFFKTRKKMKPSKTFLTGAELDDFLVEQKRA